MFDTVEDAGHVGVYFEHYAMDLACRIGRCSGWLDEESIVNTVQPIKGAIEYLHSLNQHPSDVAPRNIVVTEQGDVKLIDDLLLSSQIHPRARKYSKEDDYTRLLQTTLLLM